MSVLIFENDDDGWLAWAKTNPGGVALNVRANFSPDYMMLHRVECGTVTRSNIEGAYTARGYRKVAGSESALRDWATARDGAIKRCGLCQP